MRRRFAFVLVLALTFGLVALVAPSGGTTAGVTCTSFIGNAYFKPPLPAYPSFTKVPLKLTTANGGAGVNYCTGPVGPAGGRVLLTVGAFTKTNCRALVYGGFPATTNGTATITWTKGKPSTLSVTLTWPKKSLSPQLTGTVTAGQFKGLNASAALKLSPYGPGCTGAPLSRVTVDLASGSKFVLAKPTPPPTTTTSSSTTSTSTTTSTTSTTTTSMPATTTTEDSTTTSTTP